MKKLSFLILILSINIHASWIYFYSPDCPDCEEMFTRFGNEITNEILKLNLEYPANYQRFLHEAEFRGETNAWPRKLPVLMTGSNILRGQDKILNFLSAGKVFEKKNIVSVSEKLPFLLNQSFGTKTKMFLVGLIDGINPCAFALMIFVCAALRLAGRRNRSLMWGSIVFVTAVAVTYLALGWGLLHSLRLFMTTPLVRTIVYALFALFTFAAAVFAIINIVKNRITIGVPEKWRRWLQRSFRKNVRFGTGLFVIAIAGIVAAGVESVCTGQVYLPALLMLEREQGRTMAAFISLLLYNLGFIIPLVIVAVGAVIGLKAAQLERWGTKQMKWANGILCILFLAFSALLFSWSYNEYSRIGRSGTDFIKRTDNTIISLSKSNAVTFITSKLGLLKSSLILCRTDSKDLYWLSKDIGITIDFWKPGIVSCPINEKYSTTEVMISENPSEKYKNINNEILKKEHSEYVGAMAWWISWQQKNGDAAFNNIPHDNLYEMINKACGSCGEAAGFQLITSRFGFNSQISPENIDSLKGNSLPTVVTWNSEGQQHAAVILENVGKDWLQARFLENNKPVFLKGPLPRSAKIYKMNIDNLQDD